MPLPVPSIPEPLTWWRCPNRPRRISSPGRGSPGSNRRRRCSCTKQREKPLGFVCLRVVFDSPALAGACYCLR